MKFSGLSKDTRQIHQLKMGICGKEVTGGLRTEKSYQKIFIILKKPGILLGNVASSLEPRAHMISIFVCWKDPGIFSIWDKPQIVYISIFPVLEFSQ